VEILQDKKKSRNITLKEGDEIKVKNHLFWILNIKRRQH
jgi:hypothetical protein